MPLSQDSQTLETSAGLVKALRAAQGDKVSKSFRPAHEGGPFLTGTFTPSPTAATLTTAPHFMAPSTPITVRFSSSTDIPNLPDTEPNANLRGIAITGFVCKAYLACVRPWR